MRLRMRAVLVLISSMKPSRGPFSTVAVGGSATERFSALRCENIKAQSHPSRNRAMSPSAILPAPSSNVRMVTSWQNEDAASRKRRNSSVPRGRDSASSARFSTGAMMSCSSNSLSERLSM